MKIFLRLCLLLFAGLGCVCATPAKERIINGKKCELKEGRLFVGGEWKFMKTGKPLRNFANENEVSQLIRDLPVLKEKGYTNLSLNCYWHHFDFVGDGSISVSLDPLRKLIDEINKLGMFASLSVETYGVGGGQVPEGFWKKYPNAVAVDSEGKEVSDTEYGFGSKVPSIFSDDYLRCSRNFIMNLCQALKDKDFLYCETTVEPQYMGNRTLDYNPNALSLYKIWRDQNKNETTWINFMRPSNVSYEDALERRLWNAFRAKSLAKWINEDSQVIKSAFNEDIWIAVDFLYADESSMENRLGWPGVFLQDLNADIIQLNWTWHLGLRVPNSLAYAELKRINKDFKKKWAISEHMTINGSDFHIEDMEPLLMNTIKNSTNFGWEFTNIAPGGDFSVYNADWSPKPTMAIVEGNWDRWMDEICKKLKGSQPLY